MRLATKLKLLFVVVSFVVVSVHLQNVGLLVPKNEKREVMLITPKAKVISPTSIPVPDSKSPEFFPKLAQFKSNGERVNPFPGPANRTLVIILGNLRCGEDAWKTLYDHVLDANSADLALMIGDTYDEYKNATMFDRAKYLWKFKEYDDWGDAIDLINGTDWRADLLPYMGDDGILGGVRGKQSTGGLLMMVRWFLIKRIHENNILQKYDRFIVTRSDHYYQCDHNLAHLDPELIWVPPDEGYGGYTDRHLVVGSEYLIRSIDLLAPMIENPESFTRSKLTMNGNIEQYQIRIWHRKGILDKFQAFKRMMFVCAAPGDKTRWKAMTDLTVKQGVHIKYPGEHRKAVRFCQNQTKTNLLAKPKIAPKMKYGAKKAKTNA